VHELAIMQPIVEQITENPGDRRGTAIHSMVGEPSGRVHCGTCGLAGVTDPPEVLARCRIRRGTVIAVDDVVFLRRGWVCDVLAAAGQSALGDPTRRQLAITDRGSGG
jgi:hypothetical protein